MPFVISVPRRFFIASPNATGDNRHPTLVFSPPAAASRPQARPPRGKVQFMMSSVRFRLTCALLLLATVASAETRKMVAFPAATFTFGAPVVNTNGGVFVATSDVNIYFQDGSSAEPNRIFGAGDSVAGGTFLSLNNFRPISPIFGGEGVLALGSYELEDSGSQQILIALDAEGHLLGQVLASDAAFSEINNPVIGLPAAVHLHRTGKAGVNDLGIFGAVGPQPAPPDEPFQLFHVGFIEGNFTPMLVDTPYFPPQSGANGFNNSFFRYQGPLLGGTNGASDLFQLTGPIDPSIDLPAPEGLNPDDVAAFGLLIRPEVEGVAAWSRELLRRVNDADDPGTPPDAEPIFTITFNFEAFNLTRHTVIFAGNVQQTAPGMGGEEQAGGLASDTLDTTDENSDCDCSQADLDGDGDVDRKDVRIARKCYLEGGGDQCKDVNGNGVASELRDWECVQYCATQEGGGNKDLINPGSAVLLLRQGQPLYFEPSLTLQGFNAVRGNGIGAGAFLVSVSGPQGFSRALVGIDADASAPKVLVKTGDDLGDGPITDIQNLSNINELGQVAFTASVSGAPGPIVYRTDIVALPENAADRWEVYF